MAIDLPILNDSTYREAKALLAALPQDDYALQDMRLLGAGLDHTVAHLKSQSAREYKILVENAIVEYERVKNGVFDPSRYKGPEVLIPARIARGISQKDLAASVGMAEQQIQRYEREKYQTIKSSTWLTVARALGLKISIDASPDREVFEDFDIEASHLPEISKFLEVEDERYRSRADKIGKKDAVREFVVRALRETGREALFRKSITHRNRKSDARAEVWTARLRQCARQQMYLINEHYNPMSNEISSRLPQLTTSPDPIWSVVKFLRKAGILLVYLPPVKGSGIDGGTISVDGTPVIGITARLDRLDNFWFTLFHEIAHVELHLTRDASHQFVDSFEAVKEINFELATVEKQADDFAFGMVQPKDIWKKSLASIVDRDGWAIVQAQAKKIGVDPAILFGRIRHDRGDYSIFTKFLGAGMVRRRLEELRSEGEV